MKMYKPLIKLTAMMLMVWGCTACQKDFQPDLSVEKRRILLQFPLSDMVPVTRATDENKIEDLNILLYDQSQNCSYAFYLTNPEQLVPLDVVSGGYTVYAFANLHYALGPEITDDIRNIEDLTAEMPAEGAIPMSATTSFDCNDTSATVVFLHLERCVAKINYNISIDPGAGNIRITSLQFCSIPTRTICFDGRLPDLDKNFHDAVVYGPGAETTQPIEGTFYMPGNRQGTVSSITDQKGKCPAKAPARASYILIRGIHDNKVLAYYVYLGRNNTSDFNVYNNDEHTMNIRILNDSEVDTRIATYSLLVFDDWEMDEYADIDRYCDMTIRTSSHNLPADISLTGTLEVLEGALGFRFGSDEGASFPLYPIGPINSSGDHVREIGYNPLRVPFTKDNNKLRYKVTVADNKGGSVSSIIEHKFANQILVNSPREAGTVQVVSKDIPEYSEFCLEQGCVLTATPNAGYSFQGWYEDQKYTQLLSAVAQYTYIPSTVFKVIYAKWELTTAYNLDVVCTESNKNSTYMFNTNSVSIASTDFTGQARVEINKLSGGVLATPQYYSLALTAGQTTPVADVKFVPTQIGGVSYTIQVTTPGGLLLASKTITNTAVATTLTPTIEIGYGDEVFGAYYNIYGTSKSWSGYESVCVRVAFSPTLDYPAPLERKDLLEVKLKPQCQTFELMEKESLTNPGVMEPTEFYRSDQYPLSDVMAHYANNIEQSDYYIAISAKSIDEYRGHPTLFRPHTAGDEPYNRLLLPETSILATNAKMFDRTFVQYKMKARPDPLEIQLVSKLSGIPLKIETNIPSINYTNKLF